MKEWVEWLIKSCFLQVLWHILPRRCEQFQKQRVWYTLVPGVFLPLEESGMAIIPPGNKRVMIFISFPGVSRKWRRYLIMHEWIEAQAEAQALTKGTVDIAHLLALTSEIKLAKEELPLSDFKQYVKWTRERVIRKNELDAVLWAIE